MGQCYTVYLKMKLKDADEFVRLSRKYATDNNWSEDYMRKKLGEFVDKIDNDNWPGLPFTCEADNEDDAVEEYNRQCCDGDYYKAVEAEFEEED